MGGGNKLMSTCGRDHVKHDLDPYVCLFETCDNSDALYKHSEDWLKHMYQHKLRWRCTAKAHGVLVFSDQTEYEQHMNTAHKSARSQLSMIAARSSRSAGPIFESCPLCGESDSDGPLEDHVATHLRYLALKSLPFPEYLSDYQDSESQEVYSNASMRGKLSTFSESFEDSSLSFNTAPEKFDYPIEDIGVIERDASDSPKSDQLIPPPIANTIEPLSPAQRETRDNSCKPLVSKDNLKKTKPHVLSDMAEGNSLRDEASLFPDDLGLKSEASKGPSSDLPSENLEKDKAADLPYHAVSRAIPCESVEPENKRNISPRNSLSGTYPINQTGYLYTFSQGGGGGSPEKNCWYCCKCTHGNSPWDRPLRVLHALSLLRLSNLMSLIPNHLLFSQTLMQARSRQSPALQQK